MHKPDKRSGQSLVEILVAMAIGGLILGSAIFAITSALRSNLQSKSVRVASLLLQEIMENIRPVAVGDWHKLYTSITKATPAYVVSDAGVLKFVNGTEGVLEEDITTGLIGYWKLDEASGTSAYDSSPNGNKGTLNLGPTQAGTASCRVGGCLNFDGVDDSVSVPHNSNLDLTDKFTLSYFVKGANENAPSSYWPPMTKGSYQSSGWDSFLSNGSTTAKKGPSIRLNDSTKTPNTSSVGCPEADVATSFTHVAITVDLTATPDVVCYINGVQTGIGNFNSVYTTVKNGTQTFRIGDEGGRKIKGLMDDVRIYDRALSAAEISQLYGSVVFSRYFTVENVQRSSLDGPIVESGIDDPSTQKVTGFVTWTGGPTLSALEYLTRSRNRIELITDWASGTYSSQTGLDLSNSSQATLP